MKLTFNITSYGIFAKDLKIYPQSECIEKYQFELCSKYDREHDFGVIHTRISHALSQTEMDMLQAFK